MRISAIVILLLVALIFTGSVENDIKGVSAVPGEELTFTITVINDFRMAHTFSLSCSAPDGFNYKFISDDKEINWLSLNENESKTIQFQLEVPANAEEGTHLVWINAAGSQCLRIDVHNPDKALEIAPLFTGIKMEAGDTIKVPITIRNDINVRSEVELSCNLPEKWNYKFLEGGTEIFRTTLEPYEEKDLTLEIEANSEAEVGQYVVKPYFNHQSTEISMYISETHRGEDGKIKLKLLSKDGKAVSFATIRATKVMGNTTEVSTSSEGEGLVELDQGEYDIEILKEGFYTKNIEGIEVNAGLTTDLGIILLQKRPYYADVTVNNPVASFTLGSGKPLFKFRIENRGYKDDSYKLNLNLPEKFYYRFKESRDSSESISEIFIGGGESKDVYLEVIPPNDVETGNYNLTLFVKGSCGIVKRNLTLSLKGECSLDVKPAGGRYLTTTESGKLSKLDLIVENAGRGATITNIKIGVNAPNGWNKYVEPEEIPAIQSGDAKNVIIKVLPPPDTIPNEYEVKVSVESDQTSVEEEFRVVVKDKSYTPLLGVLVICFSLVVLGLIYRRFGRK